MRGTSGDLPREGQGESHQHSVLLSRRCVHACVRGRVCECDVNVYIYIPLRLFQNWIGSEAVKRKRKAGILPRPKVDISGVYACVCLSVSLSAIVEACEVCCSDSCHMRI